MQIKHFLYLILFCSLLGVSACDDQIENLDIDYKYEYFPLSIGKYIIYDVDSVTYSFESGGGTAVETVDFEWKETVVDTFRDAQNRLVYEVERTRRDSSQQAWRLVNVLTITKTGERLERVENNRRFVALFFPLKTTIAPLNLYQYFSELETIAVSGDVIEAFKGWEYVVTEVDVTATVNDFSFNETATVSYADMENAIELRSVTAQYAKNIGLISKELKILDTQCISACAGQTWEEKAEKGFILKMKIKEYN